MTERHHGPLGRLLRWMWLERCWPVGPIVLPEDRSGLRARAGWFLRCIADRIDQEHAIHSLGHAYTFEEGRGIVVREGSQGTPLWVHHHERQRADDEADTEHYQVEWETMTARRVGGTR
ncbi:MAG TPA: hypothetical protein VF228_17330 [Iamia sp.]